MVQKKGAGQGQHPAKENPIFFSPHFCRDRNHVERFLNRTKNCHRVATRRSKSLPLRFFNFIENERDILILGWKIISTVIGNNNIMKIPTSVTPALWGAAGGAAILAIVGFGWGGWVLGSSATEMADKQAEVAVTAALTPICVERFLQQPDSAAKLVMLKETTSYKQTSFVEEGGWAKMTGSDEAEPGTAKACAQALTSLAN